LLCTSLPRRSSPASAIFLLPLLNFIGCDTLVMHYVPVGCRVELLVDRNGPVPLMLTAAISIVYKVLGSRSTTVYSLVSEDTIVSAV
jgi:hypothetical protein